MLKIFWINTVRALL